MLDVEDVEITTTAAVIVTVVTVKPVTAPKVEQEDPETPPPVCVWKTENPPGRRDSPFRAAAVHRERLETE